VNDDRRRQDLGPGPTGDKQLPIRSVAVARRNPTWSYLGGGEAEIRWEITRATACYSRTDGGKTGRTSVSPTRGECEDAACIDDPDSRLSRGVRHPAAPNPERGVYRSKTAHKSWRRCS